MKNACSDDATTLLPTTIELLFVKIQSNDAKFQFLKVLLQSNLIITNLKGKG